VRYRKRRHPRAGLNGRADYRQLYGGIGLRQENDHQRRNWRDETDITSFYFTRFPEDVTEMELWTQFRKWGEVKEIFIPKQRNKEGRRYGFVRFKGVSDKRRTKRNLDNIIVGGLKLHVNIPKYGRGKTSQDQNKDNHKKKGKGVADMDRMEEASNRAAHSKATNRTYAEAMVPQSKRITQRRTAGTHFAGYGGSHSSLTLDISEEDKMRYNDAWVGRLKKPEIFDRLEDEVSWTLDPGVSPKYLGADMTLLLDLRRESSRDNK